MKLIDYSEEYKNLVTFTPNKNKLIHRWYPLVEGFSAELVEKIIEEQESIPTNCLDPFGGVGTTSLTCKELNINSTSIELSPFFYDVASAKLNYKEFNSKELNSLILELENKLRLVRGAVKHPELESKTFFENSGRAKWIFHKTASNGIFDIQNAIKDVCLEDYTKYEPLFKISLSVILQEVSNVFKNGKCLSYKKNWQGKQYRRKEVHELFLTHLKSVILKDLEQIESRNEVNSKNIILFGDSRKKIKEIKKKVDLVITSPPYLNSRDYTDIYRLELWMLGYVSNFRKERSIRSGALTSHVQIQLPKVDYPKVKELELAIDYLESDKAELWNSNIPNMVRGYFNDMQNLLLDLKPKLNSNAKLYINVSNSAYSNYIIEVDVIIAKAAEIIGYECEEIRIARPIKTSSQQAKKMDTERMRESIIVLKNI